MFLDNCNPELSLFSSRFDTMIPFSLPDHDNREKIASQYAKHLKQSEIMHLAEATEGYDFEKFLDFEENINHTYLEIMLASTKC